MPAVALVLSACMGPVRELYPEDPDERPIPVYIVKVGWHAGLVVESEYLSDEFPDHDRMPEAERFKVGWGDDKYYPDPDASFGILLRAALWPTRSVLHVVGIDAPVEESFSGSEVITLHVSEEGMDEISKFIIDRFRRDDDGEVVYHSFGRYSNSAFFKATGRYYVPKTSNVWTARALRRAGIPITPMYGVTAGNVMRQARGVAADDKKME
ncbi:DUF2459 domain-containing protein [Natronogracilivirgula saccharolytica]|uniref:DUF2459 domain-containing protein n=2 Tax=Natronogracilivirga saccharolytica TaxID=2812953 RepID=A0A8J7S6T9_9BACT|nr:DUF2459 domain-containing protein [Natronogracilivirga saccharolytica]